MGNTASVVPNESDGKKGNKLKAPRQKESRKEAAPAPKALRPERSDLGKSNPKATDAGAKASKPVKAPEVALTPPKSDTLAVSTTGVDAKDHAPTIDSGSARTSDQPKIDVEPDVCNAQDDSGSLKGGKPQAKEMKQDKMSEVDDTPPKQDIDLGSGKHDTRRGSSRERTASSGANSSGSNSSGSYTSSSYTSGSEESGDDDASDDTFFVPEDKAEAINENTRQSPDGGGGDGGDGSGGSGVVVRVIVDGDREDSELPVLPSDGNDQTEQEEKEKLGSKAGRSKRKRPAHRHYIKDETMRTLFGLLPFYGGDDGPMDQMVKATLASVGPNTIDVRNEAGDTLLILACQHGCEDLVEPILAKGANPATVNAVGISPLHYTCFADSLSFDAAEALLWRGADPSIAETTYGCTPLHYAASSGDEEVCALLLEHGAQPQTQDYYTYTAVKYAKDAGHEAIVELLGGEEDGEAWVEVEELYTGTDAGEDGEESGPTGGLWIRHMDPQTGLAYYMNDETGESWWETDLQTVAKEFLATASGTDGSAGTKTGSPLPATRLPPLGVREWLVQEQVRSWLVAIFSRADPLRLMEVDLVMQIGKVNFKDMLQALMLRYGFKDFDFLRKASSPKLEPLGVSALLPAEVELAKAGDDKPSSPPSEASCSKVEHDAQSKPAQEDNEERKGTEPPELAPATPIIRRHSSSAGATGEAGDGQEGVRDNGVNNSSTNNKPALHRVVSSQHSLKRVDSPAVLRAEADKVFQEAISHQEKQLADERKRQENVLEEQRKILQSLEDMMKKRETDLAKTKKEAEEASSEVTKLQSALADDNAGQAATDSLLEEIAKLKASVAAERVRFSHITEALEATKGSAEERMAKQQAQEEDRRVRLERMRTENEEEVSKIRTEAADALSKAEQAWESERNEMERDLTQKVEQESSLLKETVESAAKTLSDAVAATKAASDAAKQGGGKIDEARAWMKSKAEAHASSKQIDQTNKQLHTSLRRELERAKQLHNQIEDMKGQTRMYARVRPMDALEKEAGCKEVCLRDGKQTLALLTAAQQHWTYTQVFQNPSAEIAAKTAGQAELHKEVAGLGTTLADGHNVLLMAVGASRSGKTMTLVGEPDAAAAAAGTCGYFVPEALSEDGGGAGAKAGAAPAPTASHGDAKRQPKKGKGKGGAGGGRGAEEALGDGGGGVALVATPLAGVFPRLLAEAFATLGHRVAQCAFVVWVSAAAVSLPEGADAAGSRGGVVESLLPPTSASNDSDPAGSGEQVEGSGGDGDGATADQTKNERDPGVPPRAPPEDGGLWGRAVAASSPQEVMKVIADARLRAASLSATPAEGNAPVMREDRHFLSRVRVELVNRSTNEVSSCEMVIVELAEEKPGEAWPAALAEIVRAHAAATAANNKGDEADGFLGLIRGCLADTAKVVTLLCASPADNHAEKTERVLSFGKACENSGEDGAAQLKDLKKELARLKKEAKGTKKTAPSQLPRPAGGRRS